MKKTKNLIKTLLSEKSIRELEKHYQDAKQIWYEKKYGRDCVSHRGRIIWINPNSVRYMLLPKFYNNHIHPPYVLNGDWDIKKDITSTIWSTSSDKNNPSKRELVPIENYVLYQSMRKRYNQGIPWEKTEHHKRCIEVLKDDKTVWKACETENDVYKMYDKVDSIYNRIQSEGYKTQNELNDKKDYSHRANSEVLVNIGRYGNIIFDEGRHRFIISKILSLDRIPVRVLVRHKHWQLMRKQVANSDIGDISPWLESHPDMIDLV